MRASVVAALHRGNEPHLPTVYLSGLRPGTDAAVAPRGEPGEGARMGDDDALATVSRLSVPLREQGNSLGELTVAARPLATVQGPKSRWRGHGNA